MEAAAKTRQGLIHNDVALKFMLGYICFWWGDVCIYKVLLSIGIILCHDTGNRLSERRSDE